jgi:hypothetical protein
MDTGLDRSTLANFCGAYALWAEATETIGSFAERVFDLIALRFEREPPSRNSDDYRIRV